MLRALVPVFALLSALGATLFCSTANAGQQPNPPRLSLGTFASSVPVAWIAPTETVEDAPATDLAGFKVYFGESSSDLRYFKEVPYPAATSAVVEGLAPGTWYFAVTAYNSAREESEKSNLGSITL